ncbi:MAG: hypothetical protein ABI955_10150, partial [Nitrospirota bacterium]
MGPQWAETDTQSLTKIQIRTTMPESTHVRSGVELAETPAASDRQWRVLLVDDNAAVRIVLKGLLEEHADLQVVGEA